MMQVFSGNFEGQGSGRCQQEQRKGLGGSEHFLLLALLNSPLDREEIFRTYKRFGVLFGVSIPPNGDPEAQPMAARGGCCPGLRLIDSLAEGS